MTVAEKGKIHILHVVGGMVRAGTETWLMHILRHIDRDRFRIDFLVHTVEPCPYDDEARTLGSKIIPCLYPHQPWRYTFEFKQILRQYGPYDIVHSHIHHYNGFILRLARQVGVPVRIAHSHLDTSSQEAEAGLYRRLYLALMRYWIHRYATIGLAASRDAACDLFGKDWQTDTRWRTLYCGVDFTPFKDFVDSAAVRAEFGIPADAFVIGHVGRFDEQKNHKFIIEIIAEVAKREPKIWFLLVGDGQLWPDIKQKVVQMGLADRVIFTGSRPDVPRLMLGAMNLFLFPSLFEGLGLVLVEAQAAAMHCILSDVVPKEVDVIQPLMHRISLWQPVSTWADAVLAIQKTASTMAQADILPTLEKSQFNIAHSLAAIEKTYLETLFSVSR